MCFSFLQVCFFIAPLLCSAQWCYQSQYTCDYKCRVPSQWVSDIPVCGGQSQSPINIVTRKVQYDPSLTPIIFVNYTVAMNITVVNIGYSAAFYLPPSVRIHGGRLPGTYKSVQFHLHWGSDSGPGAEHTVDGDQYPMEVHIVHIKEKYNTLSEAMNDSVGVAALGFFFQVSAEENKQFNKVIEALGRVRYNGTSSEIIGFHMSDILTSLDKFSSYYRYAGSLTIPGCNEAIIWTIFQQPIFISQQQLSAVTKQMLFSDGKPMIDTFRPLQNINSRIVYTSMACPGMSPGSVSLLLCLLVLLELIPE